MVESVVSSLSEKTNEETKKNTTTQVAEHVHSDKQIDTIKKNDTTDIKTNKYKHRSGKCAGVILIDPWCGNIYDSSSYRVMVVQQRNSGAWGLPKGHIEKEEDIACAAQRELYEETGISFETLNENVDYIPLEIRKIHNVSSSAQQPNHVTIKKIHFFVYILLRRGTSLNHMQYDQKEISAVSWMNVHRWHVDTSQYVSSQPLMSTHPHNYPQPARFNRTLADTSVNTLKDLCDKTCTQLRMKFGHNESSTKECSKHICENLF